MSASANRRLQAIPVRTETSSGNVAPLLHEIRHALAALAHSGTSNIIDLQGIPMAPGEHESLLAALGHGEVRAEMETLGRSEIVETSYPGVWIVTHYDEMGDLKARFIEVTRMPEILESQPIDITDGLARMEAALQVMR
ncbi:MAG: hydrogenase expression/formation C-terminal domain-containing protein [Steroidobacteraceae bacterium]